MHLAKRPLRTWRRRSDRDDLRQKRSRGCTGRRALRGALFSGSIGQLALAACINSLLHGGTRCSALQPRCVGTSARAKCVGRLAFGCGCDVAAGCSGGGAASGSETVASAIHPAAAGRKGRGRPSSASGSTRALHTEQQAPSGRAAFYQGSESRTRKRQQRQERRRWRALAPARPDNKRQARSGLVCPQRWRQYARPRVPGGHRQQPLQLQPRWLEAQAPEQRR